MDYIQSIVYKNTQYPYEKRTQQLNDFSKCKSQAECYNKYKDTFLSFIDFMNLCCGEKLYETPESKKKKLYFHESENIELIKKCSEYSVILNKYDNITILNKLKIDWYSNKYAHDKFTDENYDIKQKDDEFYVIDKNNKDSIILNCKSTEINENTNVLSNNILHFNVKPLFYNYCESNIDN